MNKILTLTDFSSVAGYAIDAALQIAKKHNADLEIYHMLNSNNHILYELDKDPELYVKNKRDKIISVKLDTWKQKSIDMGVNTHFVVGAIDLVDGVKEIIKARQIDLIVMGSTGVDETDSIWGTTTQRMIKNVDVPVLVVKSKMKDYRFDDLTFVSDLDVEDQAVLTKALILINPPSDALVRLMTVNTSSFYTQPRNLMTSVLKDFEKLVSPMSTDTTFYNDYSVKSGIRHFLENIDPDILIMSNRDRHPLKNLFVPNAALDAAGTVDCPVLILK